MRPAWEKKNRGPEEAFRRRCRSRSKGTARDGGLMRAAPAVDRRHRQESALASYVSSAPIREQRQRARSPPHVARGEKLEEQSGDDRIVESSRDRTSTFRGQRALDQAPPGLRRAAQISPVAPRILQGQH